MLIVRQVSYIEIYMEKIRDLLDSYQTKVKKLPYNHSFAFDVRKRSRLASPNHRRKQGWDLLSPQAMWICTKLHLVTLLVGVNFDRDIVGRAEHITYA